MTITFTRPATAEPATGTREPVPSPQFPHGSRIMIAAGTRDITGSALTANEHAGTVTGTIEHPHAGTEFLMVTTDAGTDVTVPASAAVLPPAAVVAEWGVEVYERGQWKPVAALRGAPISTTVRIEPSQALLDAYVLRYAARARMPHRETRVMISVPGTELVAVHTEPATGDRPTARYALAFTLVSGEHREVTFGSDRARTAGAVALRQDCLVASVTAGIPQAG